MAAPNYDYMYQPGGSLGFRAPSYVERDKQIMTCMSRIKAGKFLLCFQLSADG